MRPCFNVSGLSLKTCGLVHNAGILQELFYCYQESEEVPVFLISYEYFRSSMVYLKSVYGVYLAL
jgi:hypothetical protein